MFKYRLKEFSKMHGCGNDFVVFETKNIQSLLVEDKDKEIDFNYIAKTISNRKLSVGCDQLIIVNSSHQPSENTDYEMLVYNADGSEASMCGNGIRCFSKYILDNQIKSKGGVVVINEQLVYTKAGIIKTYPQMSSSTTTTLNMNIKVDMSNAYVLNTTKSVSIEKEVLIAGKTDSSKYQISIPYHHKFIECILVSIGTPHCVLFFERNREVLNESEFNEMDISIISKYLQKHSLFRNGCNVEFVMKLQDNSFLSRVYENGSGETLACGTGACGVAVASVLCGYSQIDKDIKIQMPGGLLSISWNGENSVFKNASATTVFTSSIDI